LKKTQQDDIDIRNPTPAASARPRAGRAPRQCVYVRYLHATALLQAEPRSAIQHTCKRIVRVILISCVITPASAPFAHAHTRLTPRGLPRGLALRRRQRPLPLTHKVGGGAAQVRRRKLVDSGPGDGGAVRAERRRRAGRRRARR